MMRQNCFKKMNISDRVFDMKTLLERCEEAIRQEVLKELGGKLVSQSYSKSCILNETSGKYRVVDVSVEIEERTHYDNYMGFDYTEINITVEAETLKAKQKRTFTYDLI